MEIFTGQGVTDAARADLKKEMTKRNVRKAILDNVLLKILSGGGQQPSTLDSSNGKDDYTQPENKPIAPVMPIRAQSSNQSVFDAETPSNRANDVTSGDTDVTPVYVS